MQSLREYLRLAIGASGAMVSGYRRPLGYQQVTVQIVAAGLTLPTPPAGLLIGYAVIQVQSNVSTDYAVWRDDGTAPTATVGMRLFAGQELDYSGDLTMIQFIVGVGNPILNVSLYA